MRLSPILSLRDSTDPHADALDLAHLKASTIGNNELSSISWGQASRPDIIPFIAKSEEAGILKELNIPAITAEQTDGLGSKVERTEHIVIRDLDLPQIAQPNNGVGRIIAHANWVYCSSKFADSDMAKFSPSSTERKELTGPVATAATDYFEEESYRIAVAHAGGRECYMLVGISTLDTHLRKGIATKLVEWIFPLADATTRPVALTASPAGAPLYRKNGFVDIGGENGEVTVPLEKYGGTKGFIHHHIAMERAPKSGSV